VHRHRQLEAGPSATAPSSRQQPQDAMRPRGNTGRASWGASGTSTRTDGRPLTVRPRALDAEPDAGRWHAVERSHSSVPDGVRDRCSVSCGCFSEARCRAKTVR